MLDYKQFGANTITGHKAKEKEWSGIQNNFKTATMEHILLYSNEAWKALCKPSGVHDNEYSNEHSDN